MGCQLLHDLGSCDLGGQCQALSLTQEKKRGRNCVGQLTNFQCMFLPILFLKIFFTGAFFFLMTLQKTDIRIKKPDLFCYGLLLLWNVLASIVRKISDPIVRILEVFLFCFFSLSLEC